MTTLYNEEVIISGGEQHITRVVKGVAKEPMPTEGFDYSAMADEVSMRENGWAIIRRYPISDSTSHMKKVWKDISEVGVPTHLWDSKETGFTVIWIWDDQNPRTWGEFDTFTITMGPKTQKRFGVLGQPTYLHETFKYVRVLWNDEPEGKDPSDHVVVTYRIWADLSGLTVDGKPVPEELVDGNNIIRPWIMRRGAKNIYRRLRKQGVDIKKARRIAGAHWHSKINNGRLRTPYGLGKGDDVVAASDEAVDADFIIFLPNLKTEIKAKDGVLRYLSFPQVQHDKVRMNRQSIAHFWEPLFEGHVEPHFVERIDEMIALFYKGDVPGWLKEPAQPRRRNDEDAEEFDHVMVQSFKDRFLYVLDELGSLNNIPSMLDMARRQMKNMVEPKGVKDDERGKYMFIPGAINRSFRSYTSYRLAGYPPVDLQKGEYFLHDIGIVVEDEAYIAMLPILGGGDADDKVTCLERYATANHTRTVHQHTDEFATYTFKVKKHERILIIFRDPIGVASNGEEVASEWFLLKPASIQSEVMDRCTPIDLNKMPRITMELEYPEPMLVVRDKPVPDEWTPEYALESVRASAQYQGAYAIHSNLMTLIARTRYPIPFTAFETVFADECQQIQDPENMAKILAINEWMHDLLQEAAVAGDLELELCDKKRLGFKYGKARPGIYTNLAAFHRREVLRFEAAARFWTTERVVPAVLTRLADYRTSEKTKLLTYIDDTVELYKQHHGITDRFLEYDAWNFIGDYVVEQLSTDSARSDGTQFTAWSEERWTAEILQSAYFLLTNKAAGVGHFDQALTNGALLVRYVEALKTL